MKDLSHVLLQAEVSSDVGNSSITVSKYRRTFGWSQKQSLLLRKPLNKDSKQLRALLTSSTQDTSTSFVNDGKIGVLLLNLGGPETLDDVQPFLFNLFAHPVFSYFLLYLFFILVLQFMQSGKLFRLNRSV